MEKETKKHGEERNENKSNNSEVDDLKIKREQLVNSAKNFFSSVFSSDKKEDQTDDLAQKRKQTIDFMKKNKSWLIYIALAAIIIFGLFIRVQNFWLLHDVNTNEWIPTDLDSHIYLKYAKLINELGYLPDTDMERFVPVGAPTANYAFPAYIIYSLYKVMHFFNPAVTIEYADVIYPLVAFAVGILFFFLFVRQIFGSKTGFGNSIALTASFFLTIIPAYLQRTVGGSSDHDALGMTFLFLSLYLFLLAWQSLSWKKAVGWGIAAGISTGLTGLSWGAWKFLALIFAVFALVELFLQKVKKEQIYVYTTWLLFSIITMIAWVPLITLKSLIKSATTLLPMMVLAILVVYYLLSNLSWGKKVELWFKVKLPLPVISVIIAGVLGVVLLMVVLSPAQISLQMKEAKLLLLNPMGKDRWELTVAEQHQPYFKDIMGNFGPQFGLPTFTIPVFYYLFLAGLVLLGYSMLGNTEKKVKPTIVLLLFILALMASRYSGEGSLNGKTNLSLFIFFGSFIALAALFIYYYLHSFKHDKTAFAELASWKGEYIFVLIWTVFMLLAARGAVRLIFIFAPVVMLIGSYTLIRAAEFAYHLKKPVWKWSALAVLVIVLISPLAAPFQGAINNFTSDSLKQAKYAGPPYDPQWQIAGKWVKENIAEDAIFGHWWDYGYWVQNGWERASVLDGANKVKYWNYLMGRHVLTAENQTEALEFLIAHKTTHYLIVSDEIGKYTAYSSIGSDENYDRYGWINTFTINKQATQETRNETVLMFQGGHALDGDFIWKGTVYPRGDAGIGAVFLPMREKFRTEGNETIKSVEFQQPSVALVYRGQRIDVPLECLYFNGKMIKFDNPGMNGCFRIVPHLDGKGQPKDMLGTGLFVSEKGMRALWVNMYVFEQNNPDYPTNYFKSVYSDQYISQLAWVEGRGLMGPIKVWEIEYPEGFSISPELEELYLGGNENLPDYFFKV